MKAKLVITDLDNTLYDWVTFFSTSFSAMIGVLTKILHVDAETLYGEFKKVHQEYGNVEQPFAVLDLPLVQEHFQSHDRTTIIKHLEPALKAFNAARNKTLRLYPGVRKTLKALKRSGLVTVVGHTEAIAENAYYRLRKLDAWEYLEHLYALKGTLKPHPRGRAQHNNPPKSWVEMLPAGERKPNPELLLDICERQGVSPRETIYVGDSITRDISMAKEAGVFAVWAQYGVQYKQADWETLIKITHWSEEDVERERLLKSRSGDVKPDLAIQSFDQILPLTALQTDHSIETPKLTTLVQSLA